MGTLRTLLVLFGAIAIGLVGYQIGLSVDQNAAAPIPAGAAPVAYWYGPHLFGFGFLGLLVPILFFFLFVGVVSAAFSGGRGWGHGERHRARLAELHRELHAAGPAGPAGGPQERT